MCTEDGTYHCGEAVVESIKAGNAWITGVDGVAATITTLSYCPHLTCVVLPYITTLPGASENKLGAPRTVLRLQALEPDAYLVGDGVVDFSHARVGALAVALTAVNPDATAYGRAAFEYVRDRIRHSWDALDPRVTVSASQVVREGVGLYYAKAHLLAALLRARRIPAGLCYQRLTEDGSVHQLHGLVAVYLEGGSHRQDPRGNRPGVDAQFSLDGERLAWQVRPELGERDYPRVFVSPHPAVIAALRSTVDVLELCVGGLPAEI